MAPTSRQHVCMSSPSGTVRLSRRAGQRGLAACISAALALSLAAGVAAQQAGNDPPLDINEIESQPAARPAPAGGTPVADTSNVVATPAQAGPGDGPSYRVGRFILEFRTPHEQHPAWDDLLDAEVTLCVTPDGFVSQFQVDERGGPVIDSAGALTLREGRRVTMRLREVTEGAPTIFFNSALRDVCQAVADKLNSKGIIAVFVHPAEDMIDPSGPTDLRAGATTDLRLIIWTGRIEQVRTLASGERLEKSIERGDLERTNPADRVHERVLAHSPVAQGDLVNRAMIDDYVFRLNRHPGRRVDITVAPGTEPEQVLLEYMVTESKPWTAYFQLSNTGTDSTSVWRQRFGFVHNQLTKSDDILRLDYITGNFDEAHAVTLSYDFPIISDKLRLRTYGSYAQYDASEVGFADETFSGRNWTIGTELVGNIFQRRQLFVDAVAGISWQNIRVENTIIEQEGEDDFFTPYVGLNLERFTDDSATFASVRYRWNADGLDAEERELLGRPQVDEYFSVIQFEAEHSFYVEPLLDRLGFRGSDGKGYSSLAHELAMNVRGQWGLDNRLIPNEQDVAGGLFTVRGYPESAAAGDNVYSGTFEYRFHLANALTASEPGRVGQRQMPNFFGSDFRWAPQQPFGRADWDLIFKGFFDWASVDMNDKVAGESPDTLISTGVGLELLIKRNFSMRLDWGVALKDVGELDPGTGKPDVEAGDSRLHFLMTLSY
jgi:hemolysin activation/secretion protein